MAGHLDAVGDHEGGVEADAELADQAEPFLGVLHPLEEGLGARAGQGAEIVDQLLAIHADAVVGDRQGLGRRVGLDADGELVVARQQVGLRDRLVAHLVERVGGVGNQFAQEDIGLGIDRVNHQVQKLRDFRLELMRLGAGVPVHA